MTLHDAWAWMESFTNLEKQPSATKRTWRLDRMHALLAQRNHPERAMIGLHVAGSKGKGSTAAFLASILTQAGWSTGLYASPHVADWRERITLNGHWFPDAVYLRAVDDLRTFWNQLPASEKARFVEDWGGEPTTFEWLTLAAFEIFRNEGTDAQVLETGLGGRLDATNTQTPLASVLTLIEREHTEILGDTLPLIAAEKAGIIKKGVPVFVAPQPLEVLSVFRQAAQANGSRLYSFDEEIEDLDIALDREGTRLLVEFVDGSGVQARLPLLGLAQGTNAALAALVVKTLVIEGLLPLNTGLSLEEVLRRGLETVDLTGRMQILARDPYVVVDGAHTAGSVALLARSWKTLFGDQGTLIFGAFAGKDIEAMARTLAPLFPRVVVTKPSDFRPSDPAALAQAFENAPHAPTVIHIASNPAEALTWALSQPEPGPILACGSFYLVGELLNSRR